MTAKNRFRPRHTALVGVLLSLSSTFLVSTPCVGAELQTTAAERGRLYGEDNLYFESYGRRIAMDADWMVTAGVDQAVVWQHDGADWNATQVLAPRIGGISDVALHGEWLAISHALTPYGAGGPIDGFVVVYRKTGLDGWVEQTRWSAPANSVTGFEVHNFGSAVDIFEGTLVVSAPDSRECCSGNIDGPGFIFVYEWDGTDWELENYLADSSARWRYFGASLDIEGDTQGTFIVAGAPAELGAGPNEFGAGYIYQKTGNGWNRMRVVDPIFDDDPFNDRNWGVHVANDRGRFMAVGGNDGVTIITNNGAFGGFAFDDVLLPGRWLRSSTDGLDFHDGHLLYVDSANDVVTSISRNNDRWQAAQTLLNPFGSYPSGAAVDMGRAAIGYPTESVAGPRTGSFMTYTRPAQFVADRSLSYGDAQPGDEFGASIDAFIDSDGNMVSLVGAPGDRSGQEARGAAYLFRYSIESDRWHKFGRWQPDDLRGNAGFGTAVAYSASGGQAVGAPWNEIDGRPHGSAYVRGTPGGPMRFDAPGPDERFGLSVALGGPDDRNLAVGAPSADARGVVYVYTNDGANWDIGVRVRGTSLLFDPPTSGAAFGTTVAMTEDLLVIGAPTDSRDGIDAGAVFVYGRDNRTWVPLQRLETSLVSPNDRFGSAIAIAGDWIFVGAPGDDTVADEAGAVFAFSFDGTQFAYVEQLTADDGAPGDSFGSTLAVRGRDLFAGAPRVADQGVADSGAVYAFRLFAGGWIPATDRIVHNAPVVGDGAATALTVAGETLLVGTPEEDRAAPDAGAVVVMEYSSRVTVRSPIDPGIGGQPCERDFEVTFEQDFISPIDPAATDSFGGTIAVSLDTLAVAEPWSPVTVVNDQGQEVTLRVGVVHIYRRTDIAEWTLEETIVPPTDDLTPIVRVGNFGQSLALDDDLLVIGNHQAQMAHVYERTVAGWRLRTRLTPPDAGTGLQIGFGRFDLDVSEDTILVGAQNYQAPGSAIRAAGAVYFYERAAIDAWELNAGPLLSSEAHFGQHFGHDVSLDGGFAAVTGDATQPGLRSAYIFERLNGTWQETAILNADAAGATTNFGNGGMDLGGNVVVVGDPFVVDPLGQGTGGAFLWEHDGTQWIGPTVLHGSGATFQDHYGTDVAVDGGMVVVGATTSPRIPGSNRDRDGAIFTYARQNGQWTERLRLLPTPTDIRNFGITVDLSGGILVTGNRFGPDSTPDHDGVAFAFDLDCGSGCPTNSCADANCSGSVTVGDISFFVAAATQGESGWQAQFPSGQATCDFVCANDANRDGTVSVADIGAFVDALINGGCP